MTPPAARLEAFLARLYADEAACAEFIADPRAAAVRAGLEEGDVARLATVDRAALALAAASFAAKRARRCRAR
ncbi:MAG TPA: hypothetical protein VGI39_13785 [Polyangiaceae bacterium]